MIRAATVSDADAVVALEHEELGADAWSRPLVEDALSGHAGSARTLVAEVDGVVVGHAVTSVVDDLAELQRIAVAREHRRSGVGAALLAAVTRLAAEAGVHRVLLEVREDNAGAAAFYAAHGFAELARRRGYYRDGTTAVVLELRLASTMGG